MYCTVAGADEKEHPTPLYYCHGIFTDRFIFRLNFPGMRLPWDCHDQLQENNWRHCVTGPELPFFHKRKIILKIDGLVSPNMSAVESSSVSQPFQLIPREYELSCWYQMLPDHWRITQTPDYYLSSRSSQYCLPLTKVGVYENTSFENEFQGILVIHLGEFQQTWNEAKRSHQVSIPDLYFT